MDDKRIEDLEKRLKLLEDNKSVSTTVKKEKKERKPSPYNEFIKTKIAELKTSKPSISHQDRWAQATSSWKDSELNPKSKNYKK